MNVEIGTETEQFLFWKKYINGIFVAVQTGNFWPHNSDIPQEESDAEGEEEERSYEKNTEFLNRNGKNFTLNRAEKCFCVNSEQYEI
jgi:hypothetical protein